ncbi:amino acid adenylation domain-containing protein [Saccharomonospora sp. NB11]|uniref:amino acid adenylation domain-containing protein n=1 Tax=Saccharomonospora sp. NB11 TaxID=1642298 RepID=UPI0018D0D4C4|nr:amino acid adenylation domain-containing protein [Saccharomonospora sp. NB11]
MAWIMRKLVENARRCPERPALITGEETLTYAALIRQVSAVACEMQRHGILEGDVTAIALPRGTRQIVTALASLWLGSPFAVVDLDEPPARQRAQIRASLAARLVTESEAEEIEGVPTMSPGDVDGSEPAMATPGPNDAAYIVFTSGTTGSPKPVAVPHRALDNYTKQIALLLEQLRPTNTPLECASVTSFATDLGHTALFPALVSGDTVHLVDKATMRDPVTFGRYMATHSIDVLKSTPSHISVHLGLGARDVLPRKLMIFGGEPLSWELVDQVTAIGTCKVLNHYGPSETTIGVLTYSVDPRRKEHRSTNSVPLGQPLAGVSVEVVDEDLRSVPPGEPGELLVWGECVALGYIGAHDATRMRFVPVPVWHRSPDRSTSPLAFRTGDTVRKLPSGDIEFLGRADRQVKIHGQRIELGEVEAALRRSPGVRDAVVSFDTDTGLRAYLVPADAGEPPTAKSLRAFLRETLPLAAIPRGFTVLDDVPLTISGKLDRNKLAHSNRSGPTTSTGRHCGQDTAHEQR